MSSGSTFVRRHCWTNNVRQFDPSLIKLVILNVESVNVTDDHLKDGSLNILTGTEDSLYSVGPRVVQ